MVLPLRACLMSFAVTGEHDCPLVTHYCPALFHVCIYLFIQYFLFFIIPSASADKTAHIFLHQSVAAVSSRRFATPYQFPSPCFSIFSAQRSLWPVAGRRAVPRHHKQVRHIQQPAALQPAGLQHPQPGGLDLRLATCARCICIR